MGRSKVPSLITQDYLLASVAKPIQDPELIGEVKVSSMANLTVFKGMTIDALTKNQLKRPLKLQTIKLDWW